MPATKASAGRLWAVIMAGGSGTRFWPESRRKNPKQFLKIFGKTTLLEQTVNRLGNVIPPSRVLVVTQDDKVSLCRKLLPLVPRNQIFGEPVGRNTAPCAALGAALVLKKDPEAVIALLPADHLIAKEMLFRQALILAENLAQKEKYPVTFGIKPVFPHTGYGYLELDRFFQKRKTFPVYRLKCFHEKPDIKRATAFFRSGRFLWNSGMFVWRAEEVIKATDRYLPQAGRIIKKIMVVGLEKGMKKFYAAMPNISIDYGLMEKMRGRILAIPLDLGWNDVGGWQSLADLWPKDQKRNVAIGKTLLIHSEGNIIKGNKRLVALLGIKDCVVVDTPDALLVCPRHKTESIRQIVAELRKRKWEQYL